MMSPILVKKRQTLFQVVSHDLEFALSVTEYKSTNYVMQNLVVIRVSELPETRGAGGRQAASSLCGADTTDYGLARNYRINK